MGRGRQKAKQTKVARELKYHTSSIDVTALQRELSTGGPLPPARSLISDDSADSDEYGDPYAIDDDDDDGRSSYASAR